MDPVESLSAELVSELGPFRLVSVSPRERLSKTIELMKREKVGCALVVDDGHCIGVVTERDILFRMGTAQPMDIPVMEVVSGKVFSIRTTDSVGEAIKSMNRCQCRHLVVLDEAGKAVGVVSVKKILHELVEHIPSSVYNLPPDPLQVQTKPEGE
jgi:predicted transcriptional regulator